MTDNFVLNLYVFYRFQAVGVNLLKFFILICTDVFIGVLGIGLPFIPPAAPAAAGLLLPAPHRDDSGLE